MTRKLDIKVDRDTCISAGFCTAAAPDNFWQDDDRQSHVTTSPVDETDDVIDAMESCPVEAISARNAATGEQVFPPV